MGYMKDKMIEKNALEFFLESARAGTLDEYYPGMEGKRTQREMLVDTRGNTETAEGTIYMFDYVQVFVPDVIFMLSQPTVERIGSEYLFDDSFMLNRYCEKAMNSYYAAEADFYS